MIKVLVVDDDASQRHTVPALLDVVFEQLGIGSVEFMTASTLFEAADRLEENVFDIVVSDFRIPNPGRQHDGRVHREGKTIADVARQKSADTLIVVMSSDMTEQDRADTRADHFLRKGSSDFLMENLREVFRPHLKNLAAH